ncbi:MAG: anti-sigma factor domain-containing protein [Eubacteriales bacterium]
MLYKGIVLKIKQNYTIIMTDDQDYIKIKTKGNLIIGQKIIFIQDDILQKNNNRWRELSIMRKKMIAVAACLVLVLAMGGLYGLNTLHTNDVDISVASIITVDINPSIELSLNEENEVIATKALNEDAETLDLAVLIGEKAEDAVEKIVAMAKEAGFINVEDLEEDYVLVTTIPMDDSDEEKSQTLKELIKEKIEESDELQNVNVAIIKATKIQMLEAQGKKVPVGLWVVNGEIKVDGEYVSVREIFSNKERIEDFKDKGEVIEKKFEKKVGLIEKFIKKLEDEGIDASDLKTRLGQPDADIELLLTDVKVLWESCENTRNIEKNEEKTEETKERIREEGDNSEEKDKENAEALKEREREEVERAEELSEKTKEKAQEVKKAENKKVEEAKEGSAKENNGKINEEE